jgi:uncharacterized protein YbjT (DUF2867 family)
VTIVVFGAAGRTGSLVVHSLLEQNVAVRAVVRRAEQADAAALAGCEPVVLDLGRQDDPGWDAALAGADTVVWAARAHAPGAYAEIDGDACIHAQQVARDAGVIRWVQVSSMFADRPDEGPELMHEVLAAKQRSDTALARSGLQWTVVRPGGLIDAEGNGLVSVADHGGGGMISRADVAEVVVACLSEPATINTGFDVWSGEWPIAVALAELSAAG